MSLGSLYGSGQIAVIGWLNLVQVSPGEDYERCLVSNGLISDRKQFFSWLGSERQLVSE